MLKNELNNRFYELFNHLGHLSEKESIEMIEDFVKDIENLDKNDFKQLFDSDFIQVNEKKDLPKIPGYLLLDILLSYVDRKVSNGANNVFQKRKSNAIKKLQDIRNRVSTINKDSKYDSTYRLTQECIQDILSTDGKFYFDFKNVKDIDQYDYDEIDNIAVLSYFGKINSSVFEVRHGKLKNVEEGTISVSGIAYEEDKAKVNADYIENMQEYANDIIEEISYFFDGYFPKTYEEAKLLLAQKGYDFDSYSQVYTALSFRYDYLKERTIYNKDSIEFNNTNLAKFKKTKIKPAKKERQTRKGIFAKFDGKIMNRKTNRSRDEKLELLVREKNNQLMEDQSLIESVLSNRKSKEKEMVKMR